MPTSLMTWIASGLIEPEGLVPALIAVYSGFLLWNLKNASAIWLLAEFSVHTNRIYFIQLSHLFPSFYAQALKRNAAILPLAYVLVLRDDSYAKSGCLYGLQV